MDTVHTRHLVPALVALATGVVLVALLGPLGVGALRYRTSALAEVQVVGSDVAALAVVAPVCLVLAVLARRGHPAAPVLALAPAGYGAYLYSQLIMGNEYGDLPGNVERFFPLLLGVVLAAAWVAVAAWRAASALPLPPTTRRYDRAVGVVLLLLAAVVVLGLHLPGYVDAVRDVPTDPQHLTAPTAFWAVKLWDLAAVVPAAVLVGTGMLRGRAWARRPMYALLGGYVLLGCSVAGMAWAMYLQGDAGGGLAQVLVATAGVAVLATAAVGLYRPLLVAGRNPVTSERPAPTVDGAPAVPQPGAGMRELAGRGV